MQFSTRNKLRLGVFLACSASMLGTASIAASNFISPFVDEISDESIYEILNASQQSVANESASFGIPNLDPMHMADGVIIKYKANASAFSAKQMAQRTNTTMKFTRKMHNGASVYRMNKMQPALELQSMVNKLNSDPSVEFAEVNARMFPLVTPNDTNYNLQWHYQNSTAGINLPPAWDVSTGNNVNVAILDTGITNHSDLNGNVVGGYDFVSNSTNARDGNGRDSNPADEGDWTSGECGPASGSSWHGTHVAGTVGAVGNNSKGVVGVAYNANIVPIRVLAKCGGTTADIADAMVWASGGSVNGVPTNQNPAKVINLSLGGGGSCSSTSQNAVNQARANGAVVVIAAGNSNSNVANFTPASCNGVIAVAATNKSSNRATYSNFGAKIDIAAPGGQGGSEGVLSTLNNGSTTPTTEGYQYYAGTSMAAPHVAGVVALMFQADPDMTPTEAESVIKSTARPFASGSNCNTANCGDGMIDPLAAIQAVSGTTPPPPPPPPPGDNSLTNGTPETGLSGSTGNEQFFTLEVPAGATNLNFAMSGGSGDADLYVRFGAQPTTSTYDCRPFRNGNAESCPIANVQAGTYHVMVRAYANYSGVSLTGSFVDAAPPPPPPPPPADGGSSTLENLSATRNNWLHYTLDVPAGMSNLTARISGGSGDADLYVRRGARPTTGSYDCRPYRNGNAETCSINNPANDTYHISIRAFRTFSNVTLNVDWE